MAIILYLGFINSLISNFEKLSQSTMRQTPKAGVPLPDCSMV